MTSRISSDLRCLLTNLIDALADGLSRLLDSATGLVMQKTPEAQQTCSSQQNFLLRIGKKSTEMGGLSL